MPENESEKSYSVEDGLDLAVTIKNPLLQTTLAYWAEREGYANIENFCKAAIATALGSDDLDPRWNQ